MNTLVSLYWFNFDIEKFIFIENHIVMNKAFGIVVFVNTEVLVNLLISK